MRMYSHEHVCHVDHLQCARRAPAGDLWLRHLAAWVARGMRRGPRPTQPEE